MSTLSLRMLRACGWTLRFVPPPTPKSVVIFYPHTSNWDFPIGLLARNATGLRVSWVGKHTLFRWPLAGLMRRLGGIPIDRSARAGLVEALTAEFAQRESFHVATRPRGRAVAASIGAPGSTGWRSRRRCRWGWVSSTIRGVRSASSSGCR
jgi:hypothetical protein